MKYARLLFIVLSQLFAHLANAQALSTSGSEITITYTPPVAALAINQPALNFAVGTGVNTFLLSANPTSSIRIAITNETANACLGAFAISVAASSQNATSYNNQLQLWSAIALVSPTGGLVSNLSTDLPALSTIYISTSAISSRSIAIQVVNSIGGCATTSIDVIATITTVSVTSPLVSNTNGILSGGLTANVQGIIPTGSNGTPIFPVIAGALQPTTVPTLAQTLGVTNFVGVQQSILGGQSGNFTIATPPTPAASTNWGLLVYSSAGTVGGGGTGLQAPWGAGCITALGSCSGTGSAPLFEAGLANVTASNKAVINFVNTNISNLLGQVVEFTVTPTVRNAVSGAASLISPGSTLTGSTLVVATKCATAPCTATVSDTQGNTFVQVVSTTVGGGCVVSSCGQIVFVGGPTIPIGDTITITGTGGTTITQSNSIELAGLIPASSNQPSAPLLSDANKILVTGGNLPGVTDPCITTAIKQSAFANITTATTTQLVALVAGQSIYICGLNIDISSTTASTAILEYGTGATCGTGTTVLSHTFTDSTAVNAYKVYGGAAQSVYKPIPVGNALCVLTTVGTGPTIGIDVSYVQQ